MQTTASVSIPSTKAAARGRKAAEADAAGEADAGVGRFAGLIAQADEQREAARQPSAVDAPAGLLAPALVQQTAAIAAGAATAERPAESESLSLAGSGFRAGNRGGEAAEAAAGLTGAVAAGSGLQVLAGSAYRKGLPESGAALPAGGANAPGTAVGEGGTGAGGAVTDVPAAGAELAGRRADSGRALELGAAELERRGFAPATGKAEMALATEVAATRASGMVSPTTSGAGPAATARPGGVDALPPTATAAIAAALSRPPAAPADDTAAGRWARNRGAAADVSSLVRRAGGLGSAGAAEKPPHDAAAAADTVSAIDLRAVAAPALAQDTSVVEGSSRQAAAAGAAAVAGGADPGAFALTTNQVPASSTLAANRLDSAVHEPQAAGASHAVIDVPVDQAGFAEAFARQSAGLVIQGSSSAEIRLTPQDMGPIRIAISMLGDGVSLDIAAGHADTRAAIEASLPALRQMLAEEGVRISDWRLGDKTSDEEPPAGAGEAFRRQADSSGSNGDARTTGQHSSEPSHASNSFGRGRGASPFNRQGAGWTGGAAAPPDGTLRDQPAPKDGRRLVDLYV